MKNWLRVLTLMLALFLLLSLGAAAEEEELWSEEFYRIIDYTEELSDEQIESLDEECIELLKTYHLDMALIVLNTETLGSDTLESWAQDAYEYCSFGYGENRDGFMAAYNADTEEVIIRCFGNAASRVDQDYRDFICLTAPGYREEYGVFGVLYAVIRHTSNYLQDHADAPAAQNGRGGVEGKPDWYPTDPANFEKYHDPNAPRVVDTADIFTDAEEAKMEARLSEIRAELDRDIVIFTDVSAYGLGRDVYAADFYDFNGYGIGDEYEGTCLFICMDPNDRGFWTCCTGPETRKLFTEEFANQLDDRLFDYMVDGDYGDGVADWIENFRNLYRTGMPFPPDWLPIDGEFQRTHDASAPRVVDELELLSASERDSLAAQAKAISDKYGLDVAVLTLKNDSSLYNYEYIDLFYQCMGYGFGENYDGVVLALLRDHNYGTNCRIVGYGKGTEKLTEVNEERLSGKASNKYYDSDAYTALQLGLKDLAHMEKTGRVARPWSYWGWMTLLGAIAGAFFGGICLSSAKKRMASPSVRQTAGDYLVAESLRLDRTLDQYLSTSTNKRYSPVQRSSGGGGSSGGGRSSYSSSYSGSSGTSHSGSGRSF